MNSLILQTATRLIHPLLIFFSIFLLLSGHNAPGGGFIGGLMAAAGFALHAIAHDVDAAQRALRVEPHTLIGTGLLIALTGGLFGLASGRPFMTSAWREVHVEGIGTLDVGTPFVFDVGVYLVVWGITLLIVFSLAEE